MQVQIINKHPALCLHAERGCIAVHQIARRGNSAHQGSSTFSMLEFRRRQGTYRVICGGSTYSRAQYVQTQTDELMLREADAHP